MFNTFSVYCSAYLQKRISIFGWTDEPQLILPPYKPDITTSGTFVDFLVVFSQSYMLTRLNDVNNNLGKDQENSGINFVGSRMQGKSID